MNLVAIQTDVLPLRRVTALYAAKLVLRVSGAVLGGYALSAALVAWLSLVLATFVMPRSEAVVLTALAGFLIYLATMLWAFSIHSVWRLWAWLIAGTGLFSALVLGLLRWLAP